MMYLKAVWHVFQLKVIKIASSIIFEFSSAISMKQRIQCN